MRPKILTIQFRLGETALEQEQAALQREVGIYVDVDFVSALSKSIAWDAPVSLMQGYHGVILGGSGDFDFDGGRPDTDPAKQQSFAFVEQFRPLFEYLFLHDIPTLGICFGHQLIGAFAGAEVKSDPYQRKTKSHKLKIIVDSEEHFLLADIPREFYAHYGHKDALDRVPDGAVLVMTGGAECKVSALKYRQNIYTTQFHPELTYDDMIRRMKSVPGYLPEGVMAEEIFSPDPHSNVILRNFGKFVALREASLE
jgi:GMP synthase (glutamine-hydrolysing)